MESESASTRGRVDAKMRKRGKIDPIANSGGVERREERRMVVVEEREGAPFSGGRGYVLNMAESKHLREKRVDIRVRTA